MNTDSQTAPHTKGGVVEQESTHPLQASPASGVLAPHLTHRAEEAADALLVQRNNATGSADSSINLKERCKTLEDDNRALQENLDSTLKRLDAFQTELSKLKPNFRMESLPSSQCAVVIPHDTAEILPQLSTSLPALPYPSHQDAMIHHHPCIQPPPSARTIYSGTSMERKILPTGPLTSDAGAEHFLLAERRLGKLRAASVASLNVELALASEKVKGKGKQPERKRANRSRHGGSQKVPKDEDCSKELVIGAKDGSDRKSSAVGKRSGGQVKQTKLIGSSESAVPPKPNDKSVQPLMTNVPLMINAPTETSLGRLVCPPPQFPHESTFAILGMAMATRSRTRTAATASGSRFYSNSPQSQNKRKKPRGAALVDNISSAGGGSELESPPPAAKKRKKLPLKPCCQCCFWFDARSLSSGTDAAPETERKEEEEFEKEAATKRPKKRNQSLADLEDVDLDSQLTIGDQDAAHVLAALSGSKSATETILGPIQLEEDMGPTAHAMDVVDEVQRQRTQTAHVDIDDRETRMDDGHLSDLSSLPAEDDVEASDVMIKDAEDKAETGESDNWFMDDIPTMTIGAELETENDIQLTGIDRLIGNSTSSACSVDQNELAELQLSPVELPLNISHEASTSAILDTPTVLLPHVDGESCDSELSTFANVRPAATTMPGSPQVAPPGLDLEGPKLSQDESSPLHGPESQEAYSDEDAIGEWEDDVDAEGETDLDVV
ncbi:hypothetical protein C8F01DRAFT_1233557 [Mycena amicta]|nr:hypothetical protein C8F01DRAFT_1233557 [Mycena amicta]